MYKAIHQHGLDLLAIFPDAIEKDPVKLCKKLFSLEVKAHKLAENWCNGYIQTDDIDRTIQPIMSKVEKILGISATDAGIFFNGDCRGYALKVKSDKTKGTNLYRDFGGYGIIAPDFGEV